MWCFALRDELTKLNLEVSCLKLDASMGSDKEKLTYFKLYKKLHEKYLFVKAKRREEWTTREILLHEERKIVSLRVQLNKTRHGIFYPFFQSKALRKQLDLYDDSGKISKEAYFEESNGRKAAEEQLKKMLQKSSIE